jgi:hypothetical protein
VWPLLRCREDVVSLKVVGLGVRTKDLSAITLPLWLVDRIDPVLDLHDDAAVLLHERSASLYTLGGLEGESAFISLAINKVM